MDDDLLFAKIKDIIVKTFISVEPLLNSSFQMNVPHRNNCFQVFGFDIMVDYRLNPWLLEVNLSPSLACDSPLDQKIKSNMITDLFNLAGFHNQSQPDKDDDEKLPAKGSETPKNDNHDHNRKTQVKAERRGGSTNVYL